MWTRRPDEYDPLKAGSIDGTDKHPHDHGIIRALEANYYPNRIVKGNPKLTLMAFGLSPKTTEETIKKYFSKYGKVVHCRLVRDIVTGFSKQYAFIEFEKERYAHEAYTDAHRRDIDGNTISVEFECERTLPGWVPRRLGGGFGGKKESGQIRFGGRCRPFKKPLDEMGPRERLAFRHEESDRRSHVDRRYGATRPGDERRSADLNERRTSRDDKHVRRRKRDDSEGGHRRSGEDEDRRSHKRRRGEVDSDGTR